LKRILTGIAVAALLVGGVYHAQSVEAKTAKFQAAAIEGVAPHTVGNVSPHLGRATEALFRGDMTDESGLACSSGPQDNAVGVTATLAPPFGVISTTYIMRTLTGNLGTFNFTVYASGGTPGAVIGQQAIPNGGTTGTHTVTINPAINVTTQQFYFGVGWTGAGAVYPGRDTSSTPISGTSFIRAPTCGVTNFVALESIGFPGNWCFRAIIDDFIPVELQQFDVE